MLWKSELKRRRAEVERVKKSLIAPPAPLPPSKPASSAGHGLSAVDLAALGFAAAALFGPGRAARWALAAVPIVRSLRVLGTVSGVIDEFASARAEASLREWESNGRPREHARHGIN